MEEERDLAEEAYVERRNELVLIMARSIANVFSEEGILSEYIEEIEREDYTLRTALNSLKEGSEYLGLIDEILDYDDTNEGWDYWDELNDKIYNNANAESSDATNFGMFMRNYLYAKVSNIRLSRNKKLEHSISKINGMISNPAQGYWHMYSEILRYDEKEANRILKIVNSLVKKEEDAVHDIFMTEFKRLGYDV